MTARLALPKFWTKQFEEPEIQQVSESKKQARFNTRL